MQQERLQEISFDQIICPFFSRYFRHSRSLFVTGIAALFSPLFLLLFRQHRELWPGLRLSPPGPLGGGQPAAHPRGRMPQPSARVSQRVLVPSSRTASVTPPLQRPPTPAGAASAARVLDPAAQPNQPPAVVVHQRAPGTPPEEAT